MEEIHKLRSQITNIVNANFPDMTVEFTPQTPPSEIQVGLYLIFFFRAVNSFHS